MSLSAVKKAYNDISPILVVDDEEAIVETLGSVLEDEGYAVLKAKSGDEALEKVKSFNPSVIFLDMWMPGKDGIEVLREILQVNPSTQVIMISGHATITNALDAVKLGATDFIEKPFTIESVSNALTKAFTKYQEEEENEENRVKSELVGSNVKASALSIKPHPGAFTSKYAGKNLGQRTIKDSIVLYGQCLHSGAKSGLVLEPLPLNSGIHFSHLGSTHSVPAFISNVESTTLATTLRSEHVSASTIEHLFAALHAYKISNLLIKCNGEVPIFDGSSLTFCESIEETGIEEQGGEWHELVVPEKLVYKTEGDCLDELVLEPAEKFSITYELNYPKPVGQQIFTWTLEDGVQFKEEIAPARTFGFMKDIEKMQRMGLAAGGRLNNFILIGDDKIINTELRFDTELCRHKILDAVGDLFLIGRPIRAKITAKMTGHADNVAVLRKLADLLNA